MGSKTSPAPDVQAVTTAFLAAGARFVVVGGYAVIANGVVRATRDVDLLIPADDADNDAACLAALANLGSRRERDGAPLAPDLLDGVAHMRATGSGGIVDLLREGEPPLDFATVWDRAILSDLGAGPFRIAGLASIVGFKRLANRPQDRNDLLALEAEHGGLPIEPIPGVDT